MTNDLDRRWNVLPHDSSRSIFQLCDSTHPLDFYLGKDADNRRLLLLVTPDRPPVMHDMRTIGIRTFRRDDGKWSLLLTLKSEILSPMFSMLANDLIESSRNAEMSSKKSLDFVLKRMANWRRLLANGSVGVMSESEIRGLCGELVFLQRMSRLLPKSEAVRAWVGPRRADQDFQRPETAWEIKTIRPGANSVYISSELQLQTNVRSLKLVVIELVDSVPSAVGAFTINSLITSIRAELESDLDAEELFEELLAMSGYAPWPEYENYIFTEGITQTYSVTLGFPRIITEMLAAGINSVCYELSLSSCEPFRIDSDIFTELRARHGTN